MDKTSIDEAKRQVLIGLHTLIPQDSWQQSGTGPQFAPAMLGSLHLQAIVHAHAMQTAFIVCLNFDEEQVVHLARYTGLTITELLSPYIAALETVPGSKAVGIGFELSLPSGMDERDLREAGIALLFIRNKDTSKWERKELLPMIGHFL